MSRDLWGYGWRTAANYDHYHPSDFICRHPSCRPDLPREMYHSTSPHFRPGILEHGLLKSHSMDGGVPAIYMSPSPEREPYEEVWAIDTSKLNHLEEDDQGQFDEFEDIGGSYCTEDDVIPPSALRLHRPATHRLDEHYNVVPIVRHTASRTAAHEDHRHAGDFCAHPSCRPDLPREMYHGTSANWRPGVAQHGLLTEHSEDDLCPAIYMSTLPERDPHEDVWAIDTSKLNHLEEDSYYMHEFEDIGGSYCTEEDIPPSAMRLHRPATHRLDEHRNVVPIDPRTASRTAEHQLFAPLDDYYFPRYNGDPGNITDPDDPTYDDLRNAWLIGDGLNRRQPHMERGVQHGPAHADTTLTDTARHLQNMGHEFTKRIHQSAGSEYPLYRGMVVPPDFIDRHPTGSTLRLPLSSFDGDSSLAWGYSTPRTARNHPHPEWYPEDAGKDGVLLHLPQGSKALHLIDSEHVTHGDYDVIRAHRATDQNYHNLNGYDGDQEVPCDCNAAPSTSGDHRPMILHLRQRHVPAPAGTHTASRTAASEPPVVMWHPDEVESYSIPDNPIYGGNLPDLKDSIAQNGIQRPLAIHTDGEHAVLADGHHRLMAAQELGLHEVPVQVHYGAFDFDEDDDPEADELIHEHLDQHHPGWRRGSGHTASRIAMPWYHNTDAELNPGDELLPASETGHESQFADADPEMGTIYHPDKVYFYHHPTQPTYQQIREEEGPYSGNIGFGKNTYQVEPVGHVERDPEWKTNRDKWEALYDNENEIPGYHDYMAPRAQIVRKVEPEKDLKSLFNHDYFLTPQCSECRSTKHDENGNEVHSEWQNCKKLPFVIPLNEPHCPECGNWKNSSNPEDRINHQGWCSQPVSINPKEAHLMTAAVTVYTKPSCVQCDMTHKLLTRMGIEHNTVDVTQDPDAHAYVTGLGYSSAPVVVVNDGEAHWSGFRPDHLRGLVE